MYGAVREVHNLEHLVKKVEYYIAPEGRTPSEN